MPSAFAHLLSAADIVLGFIQTNDPRWQGVTFFYGIGLLWVKEDTYKFETAAENIKGTYDFSTFLWHGKDWYGS